MTVRVTGLPNIDINLGVNDGDGMHGTTSDEGRVGDGEVIHRRERRWPARDHGRRDARQGAAARRERERRVHADRPPRTRSPARSSRTRPTRTRTRSSSREELRGYLDARDDVDQLRWTGDDGTYNVIVRAENLPLAWRVGDGKPRTPGSAQVSLKHGDLIRIERTDRTATGPLSGRDTMWSVLVMP